MKFEEAVALMRKGCYVRLPMWDEKRCIYMNNGNIIVYAVGKGNEGHWAASEITSNEWEVVSEEFFREKVDIGSLVPGDHIDIEPLGNAGHPISANVLWVLPYSIDPSYYILAYQTYFTHKSIIALVDKEGRFRAPSEPSENLPWQVS